MSKRAGLALLLAAAALFLILNHAAYKGYFQDDDLDTLSWTRLTPATTYFSYLVTPRFSTRNFRPMAHLYYFVTNKWFGLDFSKYLIPLHVLHLLNIWLLWLLVRKLGVGPLAASAATFFFGFHAVLFDAWWKPMYVFDLMCATLCLACLLLYVSDRWILSLIAFCLAYKSKELAIVLPLVLACYEWLLGTRRWKRLVPFLVISVLFGVQGMLDQPDRGIDYKLRLSPEAQAATVELYSSQLFFLPFAGLGLLLLPFVIRDRRLWFGFAIASLFLFPLLLLPGRLFAVYWYLPLTGVALMFGAVAESRYRAAAVVFLLLWIPWDFLHFRESRRLNERLERQNRAYVTELLSFIHSAPDQRQFVFDYLPDGFHRWGVRGALVYTYPRGIQMKSIDEPGAQDLINSGEAAWLHWDRSRRQLDIVRYARTEQVEPYLAMEPNTPPTQLLTGWYTLEDNLRWTEPHATATLARPEGAREFEIVVSVPPDQIRHCGTVNLRILLNGQPLGEHSFTAAGLQNVRWHLPKGPAGTAHIEFQTKPSYPGPNGDLRVFGVSVKAFGFVMQ